MPKIILSYRRADSAGVSGRIFDKLVQHYGPDDVFIDIDSIPFGIDFRDHIKAVLDDSDALLAVMGPRWLEELERRKTSGDLDHVEVEIGTALRRNVPVVPILVDGTQMPPSDKLPESLQTLAYRNAAEVSSGRDFHPHMERLIRSMDRVFAAAQAAGPKPIEPIVESPQAPPISTNVAVQEPPLPDGGSAAHVVSPPPTVPPTSTGPEARSQPTTDHALRYVRSSEIAAAPPPSMVHGPLAWIRANLFSGPLNTILTLLAIFLLYVFLPPVVRFFITDAVWTGADRDVCRPEVVKGPVGACWAFVFDKINYFVYGSYPARLRWRVDIFFALLAVGVGWMLWLDAPKRVWGAIYFFVVFPILAYLLLAGADWLRLETVPTSLWGGILVTIVVSAVGIVFSLPFGILLALGRRSKLPIVRVFSVIFIEFVRGVPLITVLFMANTMLPLFLPEGVSVDRLMRPLVGVAIFASAYMAEVVRGGLQAMPKGQYEGAMSLGLNYWQMMVFIILPQALRIVIPGIVNTFIGLFKDTTLVAIVGIFDLIRTIEASRVDPTWAAPTVNTSGYAFAGIFYFICCFGMSRYSLAVERRLAAGQRR